MAFPISLFQINRHLHFANILCCDTDLLFHCFQIGLNFSSLAIDSVFQLITEHKPVEMSRQMADPDAMFLLIQVAQHLMDLINVTQRIFRWEAYPVDGTISAAIPFSPANVLGQDFSSQITNEPNLKCVLNGSGFPLSSTTRQATLKRILS